MTTMLNIAFLRDMRTLRLLCASLGLAGVLNLVSFWAVWYWPLISTVVSIYTAFVVSRSLVVGSYDAGYFANIATMAVIGLGFLQVLVGLLLIVLESDVDAARRVLQFVSMVTGAVMAVLSIVLRTSISRVFGDITRNGTLEGSQVIPKMARAGSLNGPDGTRGVPYIGDGTSGGSGVGLHDPWPAIGAEHRPRVMEVTVNPRAVDVYREANILHGSPHVQPPRNMYSRPRYAASAGRSPIHNILPPTGMATIGSATSSPHRLNYVNTEAYDYQLSPSGTHVAAVPRQQQHSHEPYGYSGVGGGVELVDREAENHRSPFAHSPQIQRQRQQQQQQQQRPYYPSLAPSVGGGGSRLSSAPTSPGMPFGGSGGGGSAFNGGGSSVVREPSGTRSPLIVQSPDARFPSSYRGEALKKSVSFA